VSIKKILISGGTGFIGKYFIMYYLNIYKETTFFVLTRKPNKQLSSSNQIIFVSSLDKVPDCDVVINLAGKSIGTYPWTKKNKEKILNSRLNITKNIVNYINQTKVKPKVFISASAVGYYNLFNDDNITINENTEVSNINTFSNTLCNLWEEEAKKVLTNNSNIKLCIVRFGVVLGKNGGFLSKIILPIKLYIFFLFGKGKNYMPWVHIEDVSRAIDFIIQQPLHTTYNIVAPSFNTQKEIASCVANFLKRKIFFYMPSFFVKILFGQMGKELFLSNQKIEPLNLLKQNFKFKYDNIKDAIKSII
jgi:uncharacterized protein (TIGR01777 family)